MTLLYKNGNELINFILTTDIKKLDYILLWGKYYNYLFSQDKNLYVKLREFISQIILNTINAIEDFSDKLELFEKNPQQNSNFLYYSSIIFEFLTFFKIRLLEKNNSEEINKNLNKFIEDFYTIENNNENKNQSIEILWNDYSTFKTIYSNYFYKLWNSISENSIDDNFNTFLIKKKPKNYFIHTLNYLYFSIDYHSNYNNGIKGILIIFHYLILLISNVKTENDIKYWTNHFLFFLLFFMWKY